MTPELKARVSIDAPLVAAGWHVCDVADANIHGSTGVELQSSRYAQGLVTGNQEHMRNIGQERIRQIRMPLPQLAKQTRIVAEVDRHLPIISEVEVDANLQRAQAFRQSTFAMAFSVGVANG